MPGGPVQTTYSMKDLVGVLTNPVLPVPFQLAGGYVGIAELTIRMLTQRTEHEVAADGSVMPSYISGANGEVTINVQQTSAIHHLLLGLYNQLTTLAETDELAAWAATTISFRTVLDGALHVLSGCSFQKIGDKPYAAKGQNVTWVLMSANVVNQ
jgi:hypothetical protein